MKLCNVESSNILLFLKQEKYFTIPNNHIFLQIKMIKKKHKNNRTELIYKYLYTCIYFDIKKKLLKVSPLKCIFSLSDYLHNTKTTPYPTHASFFKYSKTSTNSNRHNLSLCHRTRETRPPLFSSPPPRHHCLLLYPFRNWILAKTDSQIKQNRWDFLCSARGPVHNEFIRGF